MLLRVRSELVAPYRKPGCRVGVKNWCKPLCRSMPLCSGEAIDGLAGSIMTQTLLMTGKLLRRCSIECGCLLVFLLLLPRLAMGSAVVLVPEDVLEDYQRFVAGREVDIIEDYSGPDARRDVVEVVFLLQALHLGGYLQDITLRSSPDYAHTFRELVSGRAAMSGTTVWKADVERFGSKIAISQALIDNGQFRVGVYTCQSDLQEVSHYQELTRLRVISNRQWSVDWNTLKQLGFSRMETVDDWPAIVRMLCLGRADITLAPFPSGADLKIQVGQYQLMPIQQVRVELKGSRHFPVSRVAPQAGRLKRSLEKGLVILQKQGRIAKAYQDAGFYNDKVANWPVINQSLATP